MNKKTMIKYTIRLLIIISLFSCSSDSSLENNDAIETCTPVTVTNISHESLTESVELNAVSSFLLKTNVRVNVNGYLEKSNVRIGDLVKQNDVLFELKTKEAVNLGNTVNEFDSNFHFKGTLNIKAPCTGYITALDHQAGDYMQDGDQVATISDANSFVFLLNVPYELNSFLPGNNSLQLKLPDGNVLNGKIIKAMPSVDIVSQTQSYELKVDSRTMIPENLIAKVSLVKKTKSGIASLPKEAILSNEIQSEFWIMEMINDSIAVKVPVKKGIEGSGKVEIVSPSFNEKERILLSGNYGLADTAKVKVEERN